MDPESLLPFALVAAGLIGALSRRAHTGQATAGRRLAGAGESVSRSTAAGLGATGRAGVTGASKLAAGVGAAGSALAGLVVDGGVAVTRSAGRAVSGAAHVFLPRSATPPADGPSLVVTSARGTRFHRPDCSLAPVAAVAIPREEAVAGSRRPCPTCRP